MHGCIYASMNLRSHAPMNPCTYASLVRRTCRAVGWQPAGFGGWPESLSCVSVSLCLFVSLSLCLSLCLSLSVSLCLSLSLSVSLSVSVCLSLSLSVSLCLFLSLSVSLSVPLSRIVKVFGSFLLQLLPGLLSKLNKRMKSGENVVGSDDLKRTFDQRAKKTLPRERVVLGPCDNIGVLFRMICL